MNRISSLLWTFGHREINGSYVKKKNQTKPNKLKIGFLMSIYAAQSKAAVTRNQPYERNNWFWDHSLGNLVLEPWPPICLWKVTSLFSLPAIPAVLCTYEALFLHLCLILSVAINNSWVISLPWSSLLFLLFCRTVLADNNLFHFSKM